MYFLRFSCRRQPLLLDLNPVPAGYMLSALTTNPCGYKPNAFAYEVVKGFVTRSESLNKIVSITSHLRKPIVAIAFVNDFFQGGRVELYRLIALYRCILIG